MKDTNFLLMFAKALLMTLICLLAHPSLAKDGGRPVGRQHPPSRSDCPQVYVRLDSTKWVGKRMQHVLSARIPGGAAKQNLTYKWAISPGTITSGLGSSSITVEMPECQCDFSVEVEVGGLNAACGKNAGFSVHDICWYPIGVEGYGEVSYEDEKERLRKFAERLQKEPCSQMDIVVYSKKGEEPGDTSAKANRAKRFIVEEYKVEADRIRVVDGGAEGAQKTELYLLPHGITRKVVPRP